MKWWTWILIGVAIGWKLDDIIAMLKSSVITAANQPSTIPSTPQLPQLIEQNRPIVTGAKPIVSESEWIQSYVRAGMPYDQNTGEKPPQKQIYPYPGGYLDQPVDIETYDPGVQMTMPGGVEVLVAEKE